MSRLPMPSDTDAFSEQTRTAVRHILRTRNSMPPPSSYLTYTRQARALLSDLVEHLRYHTSLSEAETELAICTSARASNADYIWNGHVRLGLEAGVREEAIHAIDTYGPLDGLTADEALIIGFGRELLESPRVLVVYINGDYVPAHQASISVFDYGFLRGDTVYDTTSAWHGKIFKLDAHVDRLFDSLRAVQLEIPLAPDELKQAIVETTRRCGLRDAYIKCLVTRGRPQAGTRDLRSCTPTIIIFVTPYVWILPPEKFETGARVNIASVRSIPPQSLDPRIKSVSRLHFDLASLETYAAGMDETIMLDLDGHVTEGPGFNVFMVKHQALLTPRPAFCVGSHGTR